MQERAEALLVRQLAVLERLAAAEKAAEAEESAAAAPEKPEVAARQPGSGRGRSSRRAARGRKPQKRGGGGAEGKLNSENIKIHRPGGRDTCTVSATANG